MMSFISEYLLLISPQSYVIPFIIVTQSKLPFVQNGNADTSNFDEEFTREQPTLTPVHGQLSTRDQAEFNGFSWVGIFLDILMLSTNQSVGRGLG